MWTIDTNALESIAIGAGILGTDKQPLVPWTLNFQTGT